VIEVADIFRQHAATYRAHHSLPPQQLRAMRDIELCRTAFFGGHVAQCDHCAEVRYAYHSCRNRHCPKCHGEQSAAWLEKQQSRLLPCAHYLMTLTLPATLRPLARQHPKIVYGLLLRCAAAATQKLAADPQYLGATPAILAVLHTWTRALLYHPHVHLLVSAGGLTADQRWVTPKHPNFFVPVRALSLIFRAKMRHALGQAHLLEQTPAKTWMQPWVVHCKHAGAGEKVLGYLARYAFRVAITNSRLESFADGHVTFRYRDNRTQQLQRVTLGAEEFIGRFIQHILPPGFPKVRHYGLASSSQHASREQARTLIKPNTSTNTKDVTTNLPLSAPTGSSTLPLCPHCQIGHLIVLQILRPQRKFPP
jgi:Putative transposase/Transposase zinc-binding domain